MTEFIKIVALTGVLIVAQELLRRGGRWAWWIPFGVLALALTPHWLATNDYNWFQWVKLYTIAFCCCWGTVVRFTALGERRWVRLSIPLLLAGNVLEAVVLDATGGGWAHGLAAVAGLVLIVTIPMGRASTVAGPCRDLHLPLTRGWVIGYTAWNWAFVALNFPALLGHHTAVLAAALVVGLIDPRRWLQTRACTLGLNLLMMATFDAETTAWLDTSAWFARSAG